MEMHIRSLTKPDGRQLRLYSRHPIEHVENAPSPFPDPLHANPHMRWHPLRGEWITYAAYRQGRTFLPPPEYNPLAVTRTPDNPTELPPGDWDVAVFDNRFPSLSLEAHHPPETIVPTMPSTGKCEVVVFTQDPQSALGKLPLAHIELLLQVWAERTLQLGRHPDIQYVLPFENRGAEVGVTLHHPHGQIYAYPVVPPVPGRMMQIAAEHYSQHGRGPLEMLIEQELACDKRLIYRGEHAVAFVPVCARYPYEVWVAPIKAVPSFVELDEEQRADLARALKTVLMKYEALWNRPFPYLMAWYQAPTDEQWHPEAHLHAEFYPPYRTPDKLKYLAGTELAAGLFAMDVLPEDKALELQNVTVQLEEPAHA
ncbi:UDPglucose--hexose-1-phosphate uridylyltransferase [Novimethylophilus kurashikiensis]|uniref:Galactose-1-phosphate uridylyltransferase n=1 Tax=Novimethylophilus kurashikiensis TaxID=1825523 RepID=A0A2R5F4J5_9PROT|nr:galactose-1-phosphate uridylyltransferase [Novimethylophilus kurashikiensis]GBG13336.1 UDPglucose--hexose-1-phosphate uridylyltransferase [Novimethylophilus kurashikiensis]